MFSRVTYLVFHLSRQVTSVYLECHTFVCAHFAVFEHTFRESYMWSRSRLRSRRWEIRVRARVYIRTDVYGYMLSGFRKPPAWVSRELPEPHSDLPFGYLAHADIPCGYNFREMSHSDPHEKIIRKFLSENGPHENTIRKSYSELTINRES